MSGIDPKEWDRSFQRMTIVDSTEWDPYTADQRVPVIVEAMQAAVVTVILGNPVRYHLALPEAPWIIPQYDARRGFWWRLLPIPSVRIQTYNDPVFRAAVRLMLQELTDQ